MRSVQLENCRNDNNLKKQSCMISPDTLELIRVSIKCTYSHNNKIRTTSWHNSFKDAGKKSRYARFDSQFMKCNKYDNVIVRIYIYIYIERERRREKEIESVKEHHSIYSILIYTSHKQGTKSSENSRFKSRRSQRWQNSQFSVSPGAALCRFKDKTGSK